MSVLDNTKFFKSIEAPSITDFFNWRANQSQDDIDDLDSSITYLHDGTRGLAVYARGKIYRCSSAQEVITISSTSPSIALDSDFLYICTNPITSLDFSLTPISNNYAAEYHIIFTADAAFTGVTWPQGLIFLGTTQYPAIEPGGTYEIDIVNDMCSVGAFGIDTDYYPFTGATSSTAGTEGLVPAPSAGDEGKYLAGDGSWKTIVPQLVELSYGTSTWNDFLTAYTNHCIVYCRASSNSNPATGSQTRRAFMAYVDDNANPTSVEFQYYRSQQNHSMGQQGDQMFVYKLTSANVWSVQTRNVFTKIVAGANMSSSYASNTLTLSATDTTYNDFTGADPTNPGTSGLVPAPSAGDEGKVLRGDGSWGTPPAFTGTDGTNPGTEGSVPQPQPGDENRVLRGDGSWGNVPAFTGTDGTNPGTEGSVPQPQPGDENRVLRGDGSWGNVPAFTGTDGTNPGTEGSVPQPQPGDEKRVLRGDGTWSDLPLRYQSLGGYTPIYISFIDENNQDMISYSAIPVIYQTGDPTPYIDMEPNVFYCCDTLDSLDFNLMQSQYNLNPNNEYLDQYHIMFESGSTPTTINWPGGLKYVGGTPPTVDPNCTFEIDIVNNCVTTVAYE